MPLGSVQFSFILFRQSLQGAITNLDTKIVKILCIKYCFKIKHFQNNQAQFLQILQLLHKTTHNIYYLHKQLIIRQYFTVLYFKLLTYITF